MVVEKGNDILEGTLKESLNVTSGCFWRLAEHSLQSSLQVSQPLMRVMKTVTGLHDRIFITCLLFSFENDSAFLYPRQASVQSCYCLCEWLVAILLRLKTCVKPTYRLAREAGRWCNNHFVHLYLSESLLSRFFFSVWKWCRTTNRHLLYNFVSVIHEKAFEIFQSSKKLFLFMFSKFPKNNLHLTPLSTSDVISVENFAWIEDFLYRPHFLHFAQHTDKHAV